LDKEGEAINGSVLSEGSKRKMEEGRTLPVLPEERPLYRPVMFGIDPAPSDADLGLLLLRPPPPVVAFSWFCSVLLGPPWFSSPSALNQPKALFHIFLLIFLFQSYPKSAEPTASPAAALERRSWNGGAHQTTQQPINHSAVLLLMC
jgi:hypothetical protein